MNSAVRPHLPHEGRSEADRKIVHVLTSLGRGGIETWLMNVFRADESIRARSVICLLGPPGEPTGSYEAEIARMDIPVHRVPWTPLGAEFLVRFSRLCRRLSPSVVHAHLNAMSGWATLAARMAGVPVRIAHYHNSIQAEHRTLLRRSYVRAVRALESLSATRVVSCSSSAFESFSIWAPNWNDSFEVLPYGIDLQAFRNFEARDGIRTELELPKDAIVVGHVGRFSPQKNHEFILEVFRAFLQRVPNAALLLIGDGPLRSDMERLAGTLGVRERVRFAGLRADVPNLMRGAMDAFLFPSHYEGLGLVLIEAQASGLPCVYSDVIPAEADIVEELVRRESLEKSPEHWAKALQAHLSRRDFPSATECLVRVEGSAYNVTESIKAIRSLYESPLIESPSASSRP